MNAPWKVLPLAALAASLSCGDGSGPPLVRSGVLLLHLTTPHQDDAALVIHLSGPSIAPAAITPATNAQRLFARPAGSGAVTVALFGPLGAGALLRLHVPDLSRASDYRAAVIEAADANNALRASVSGYSGVFVRD